jgi:hypothetical protein
MDNRVSSSAKGLKHDSRNRTGRALACANVVGYTIVVAPTDRQPDLQRRTSLANGDNVPPRSRHVRVLLQLQLQLLCEAGFPALGAKRRRRASPVRSAATTQRLLEGATVDARSSRGPT